MTIEITVNSDTEITQAKRHQIKRMANVFMQQGDKVKITWPDQSTNSNPLDNHYIRQTVTHY